MDLDAALQAGGLPLLVWTAAALGFLHTILGPDHYLPFVMMAKAHRWSRRKTAWVTLACGLGHVVSSVVIGLILIGLGTAWTQWEGSSWASLHELRGSVAAWSLIGVGAALMLWGVVRALRNRPHAHPHAHEDGEVHLHGHSHHGAHMHAHGHEPAPAQLTRDPAPEQAVRRLTPWVLFTIFVFGPCESLIPLMLASWATAGVAGSGLVVGAFTLATVATIGLAVAVLLLGASRLPMAGLNRWSTALAGASLVLCGAGIQFLGL